MKNIIKSIEEINFFIYAFDLLSGKVIRKNKFGEVFLSQHNLYNDKNSNKLTKYEHATLYLYRLKSSIIIYMYL